MPYFSQFYYLDKREGFSYSRRPQGRLNVNRLVRNKGAWKKSNFSYHMKQKVLVIADWTLVGLSDRETDILLIRLGQLIKDGFPLYLWQDGKVIQLTLETLSNLRNKNVREKITPTWPDKVSQAAIEQHRLTKSQVHILDDYWINNVLNGSINENRKLSLRSFFAMKQKWPTLLPFIQKAEPPFKEFIIDILSPDVMETVKEHMRLEVILSSLLSINISPNLLIFIDLLKKLLNLNDDIILTLEIKELTLDSAQTKALIETGRISYDGVDVLTCKQLNTVESLNCSYSEEVNAEDLQKLFASMPNLKTINFNLNIKDNFKPPIKLKQLEVLDVSNSTISPDSLQQLLLATQTLKSLNLSSCPVKLREVIRNKDGKFIDDINFDCLESLDVSNTPVTSILLNEILSKTKTLKILNLSSCKRAILNFSKEINFQYLERLDLSNSEITNKNLQDILTQAKGLKSLNISKRLSNLNEVDNILELPKLEELNVSQSSIADHDLQNILIKARHIKSLNLQACNHLSGDFTEHLDFTSLEKFNANETRIGVGSLREILLQAKTLKSLELSAYSNLPEILADIKFSCLKKLNLSSIYNVGRVLNHILTTANVLEELDLHNCQIDGLLQLYNLPNLKKIDLSNSNINLVNLKALLRAAPHLQLLNIKDCRDLIVDDELKDLMKNIYVIGNLVQNSKPHTSGNSLRDSFFNFKKNKKDSSADEQPLHTPNATQKVDADTKLGSKKEYKINRTFYPLSLQAKMPDARLYRKETFNHLNINNKPCSLADAFTLGNQTTVDLTPVFISQLKTESSLIEQGNLLAANNKQSHVYFGKQGFTCTGEWQALDSLSAQELMTHYYIDPSDVDVSIQYSKRDNLYYLRGPKGQPIKISFILEVPKPDLKVDIPSDIKDLVTKYSRFKGGKLELKKAQNTGQDYLDYINTQEKGACRHRAVAFKAQMQEIHPEIPVRIVGNDCHNFVELYIQNQWVSFDLGGYPAKLTIKDTYKPTLISKSETGPISVVSNPKPISQVGLLNPNYIKYLSTWERERSTFATIPAYCLHLVDSSEVQKRLIEFTSSADVQAMRLSLQSHCKNTSRPCFYINSPDDLICSENFVAREGNQGILKKGPGGPLHDFLQAHLTTKPPPVLIVNYDNFDTDDIIRFNSLLDKERSADGTKLPTETIIVGLLNVNKPDCYQGADFYSRFDQVEADCVKPDELSAHLQSILPVSTPNGETANINTSSDIEIINLYNAPDWEEQLLGYWELRGDNLYFIEGKLHKALEKGLPIEIQNGPWDDDEFKRFWQQAFILKHIEYAGGKLELNENLKILTSQGYLWNTLTSNIKNLDNKLSVKAETLNPSLLSDFFTTYHCQDNTLIMQAGLLNDYANRTLEVNVTRDLTEDEWARFLTVCQEKQITLSIHLAPTVSLPPAIAKDSKLTEKQSSINWDDSLATNTTLIVSTDLTTTLQSTSLVDDSWLVIDVSECEPQDLLENIESNFDEQTKSFIFDKKKCALLNALDENKKIILKGHFSDELKDALAPLLIKRQNTENVKGKLVILSNENCFPYLETKNHIVTVEAKYEALIKIFNAKEIGKLNQDLLHKESFNQLKARLNHLRQYPDADSSDRNWQGLQGITGGIKLKDFNAQESAIITEEFNKKRLEAVTEILDKNPFVFITGLTGVGKSTFVKENFSPPSASLHHGESKILAWATDKTSQKKILFIDEANLSSRQWSEFEGLMRDPPGILIDGVYYPLTKEHKVIFAGNPVNYGDERQLAPLFKEYGNALVFDPLPQEFIYEKILKPVFAESLLNEHVEVISHSLLKVYRLLCDYSRDEVLISPRDIQMMALLVLSYVQRHHPLSTENIINVAKYYAYQVAVKNVPTLFQEDFDKKCKDFNDLSDRLAELVNDDYLVTASRKHIYQELNDLLALREYRQTKGVNEEQLYGGVGGIVLEGEPGIGKSELVLSLLLSNGYKEVHINKDNIEESQDNDIKEQPLAECPGKIFYRMPVSFSFEQKKELLNRAFNEGAVVIIDEINSSPMMERTLNHLLMGFNEHNKRPAFPGFMIIGTQNPVTMAGRKAPSTALARRLIKSCLPPYPSDEMNEILSRKMIQSEKVTQLVKAYEYNREKAIQENLKPPPIFRDLLRVAD
ncbi:AAA domain (dynein-related subfamily) [Legionella busanensis]|uniref:AAA domain (Dynein-related subfamily) n=1 Tax=Legionella busanensis TaxID=190655 RepID=A0A378JJJ2_9GAMM|nr:hypothetical protein [Legionella busanensis]STX50350.1 AAA domain (dynein-related subfamily) [Legionella busanensis]